jgi:ribokinase
VIVVVGSVNVDFVASVEELPQPGETVAAHAFATVSGGKGANQAVAARRLGGDVTLVAAVGSDAVSMDLRDELASEGVSVAYVKTIPDSRSGTALITVDRRGENVISVFSGANGELILSSEALELIESAEILLMQLEISMETVVAAARAARGTVVVNAAPASVLPDELVACIDVLIVNEHEGVVAVDREGSARIPTVITTLGARGASIQGEVETVIVPAPQVDVIDTTGAGDTFCGAFCASVARGETTLDAALLATRAGALATTSLGARSAMPTLADIANHHWE